MNGIAVTNYAVFWLDMFCTIYGFTALFSRLESALSSSAVSLSEALQWTGRNCIVYYFLCGGCPLVVSMLLGKVGFTYDDHCLHFLAALALVYLMATVLTWFIVNYLPFMTGRSKA